MARRTSSVVPGGQGKHVSDWQRYLGGVIIAAILVAIALLSIAAGVPRNGWGRIHSGWGDSDVPSIDPELLKRMGH